MASVQKHGTNVQLAVNWLLDGGHEMEDMNRAPAPVCDISEGILGIIVTASNLSLNQVRLAGHAAPEGPSAWLCAQF